MLYWQLEINLYSPALHVGRDGTRGAWYNDTADCIVLGCGGQVGSDCGTDAGFVRTRGIRQELHSRVKWPKPHGRSQHLVPLSPLIIRLGRWEWHGMTFLKAGGGETLPLNTSPTDRCHWPLLNLIIGVPTQGKMAWDFPWHPLNASVAPGFMLLGFWHTHLYTDAYASIYLSICLVADVADIPCWRWQYSHADPP